MLTIGWILLGNNAAYDWAICVLEQNLGSSAGGYLDASSSGNLISSAGKLVSLYGYPGELDHGEYQYEYGGYIFACLSQEMSFTAPGGRGFSGGPVINSSGLVSATYSGSNGEYGVGTRVNGNMISIINSLR